MERRRVRESNCSSGKPNVCLPLTLTGCLCSCLSYFLSTYSLLCGSRPVKEYLTTGPDVRQNVWTCVDVRALRKRMEGWGGGGIKAQTWLQPRRLKLHLHNVRLSCRMRNTRFSVRARLVDMFTCFISVTVLDREFSPSHIFLSCSSGRSSAYCVLFLMIQLAQ